MESSVYQDLVDRLNRIEQYVERTTHLLQDIDDELELSTKDLMDTLNVSESTLYRWRKKNLYAFAIRRVAMYATCISLCLSALAVTACVSQVCVMMSFWIVFCAIRISLSSRVVSLQNDDPHDDRQRASTGFDGSGPQYLQSLSGV